MSKHESAGGDGAGHDSSAKQNQQEHGSQTNIPGEMKNGHGIRSREYSAPKKLAKQEQVKSPKVFPPPGFKESKAK